MIWWVYGNVKKCSLLDDVVVATDDDRILFECKKYNIPVLMTSSAHDTPTSRLYEVSCNLDSDYYTFIGGDEPLVDSKAIDCVISEALNSKNPVTHGMTKIKTAPEVIDFTNIKVTVSTKNYLLYTTRSAIPFPKGGLEFNYMKFVGIGVFSKEALSKYNATPKSELEKIEECDLIRFLELDLKVKMVEVECRNISVDTPKDLEAVIHIIKQKELL